MLPQVSVPVHYSSLELRDYLTYLYSPLRTGDIEALRSVWEPLLGPSQLLPLPTGRHALWVFLELANYQPGDEVLISAYNFYIMVRLIVQKGLVPVFVDVDLETLCMDPKDLEKKITDRSRLVIATHMFGAPADMGGIGELCKQNELHLFEDCAHAVGTQCDGLQVGQFGDGALFSFGIYKMINAFGGGMLSLRNGFASHSSVQAGSWGDSSRVSSFFDNFVRFAMSAMLHPIPFTCVLQPATRLVPRMADLLYPSKNDPGYVFRPGKRAPYKHYMTKMIARQLGRLDENIERRRSIASRVKGRLSGLHGVTIFDEDKNGRWNAGYFGLSVPDPTSLSDSLSARGIEANPREFYNCAGLEQFSQYEVECPNATWAEKHFLRIPNYPKLSDHRVDEMAGILYADLAK